jgi:hypothetical protein
MTSRKHIGLALCIVLGAMAIAAPAGAWWGGDGRWHPDNRWQNYNERYYGYHYRAPPVVYATPYNYGYYAPPVVYDNTPGFTIRIGP